jgi:hypothetical protein
MVWYEQEVGMQFQSKAANQAYSEIVQEVGRVVAEYEREALNEEDLDRRARMRLAAKEMSIHGLATAISTAHHVECEAIGLATAFNNGRGPG